MRNEINQCPACGALRSALSAQCPECGYDFQHTNCMLVEDLNTRFENTSDKEKIEIIRSFSIPQIKEEILDLLIFIQPKATRKNSKITTEWRLRQKEVIQRAKMAFANDKKILSKVQEYEDELTRIEKQYIRQWWQKISILPKVAIIVLLVFIALLLIPAKDVSPEAYAVRFAEAVEKGKWDKALKFLDKSPEMGKLIGDQYLSLIEALIQEDRLIEAESLYNNHSRFVSSQDHSKHLSHTSCIFIQYYLDQQYYDMADKFVVDGIGAAMILKELINNEDIAVATRYFRKNSNKFMTYSPEAKKRILTIDDEVIRNFAIENNLIR